MHFLIAVVTLTFGGNGADVVTVTVPTHSYAIEFHDPDITDAVDLMAPVEVKRQDKKLSIDILEDFQ